jgi:hypothetical protein
VLYPQPIFSNDFCATVFHPGSRGTWTGTRQAATSDELKPDFFAKHLA